MESSTLLLTVAVWCAIVKGFTLPKGIQLHDNDTFEFIVVGAGAAGSAVAARLALAGRSVLLLEAGGDPGPASAIPGAAPLLLGSSIDYQYQTISNNISCLSYKHKQCTFSRGKCLGGSTSVNYMIYTRGHPQDFDDLGIPGWTWKDIEPYFLRFEGLQDLSKLPASSIPYHNTTGTIKMEFFSSSQNPWHSRIVEGYESLNFPFNPDVNAASQIGVTQVIGYVYDNERMSTARGYLSRNDVKQRLKVAMLTKCTGVIIDDDHVARGITAVDEVKNVTLRLYATKEVILSAGAIGTPQILMLSGVGHAEHLAKFNIPVVADLPVGDNLSDHPIPLMFIRVDKGGLTRNLVDVSSLVVQIVELLVLQQGPLTSDGLTDITAFLNTKCYDFEKRQLTNESSDCDMPNVQFIHAYINRNFATLGKRLFQQATGLDDDLTDQLSKINSKHAFIVFSPYLLQPYSRGTVRLASADPLAPPAIYPNFLSDERDLEEMLRAIEITEHLMETPAFKQHDASIIRLQLPGCPAYEVDRAGYWRCYSRHLTHTSFHAVGTAALGGVLDARLRVRGVRALRVCDAGAVPRLPRGNTAAAAIALGERLADMILSGTDVGS